MKGATGSCFSRRCTLGVKEIVGRSRLIRERTGKERRKEKGVAITGIEETQKSLSPLCKGGVFPFFFADWSVVTPLQG